MFESNLAVALESPENLESQAAHPTTAGEVASILGALTAPDMNELLSTPTRIRRRRAPVRFEDKYSGDYRPFRIR